MNEVEFINELKNINIDLNSKQQEQFRKYYEYLIEYNNHTNLTTITNKEDVYLKHFYDSLLITTTTNFDNINNLLDIGTGAGFPGIVIKILFPNIKVTLLDSNNKKTKFCNELINILELKDVEIINARAEDYIKTKREYYDLVTARAVKNLQILSELSIPYVKINGLFIAMKSDYNTELESSMNGINILGGEYIETKEVELPKNFGKRSFIIVKKINETNIKYPRQYNKILKQPL